MLTNDCYPKLGVSFYIGISLIAIITLSVLLYKCNNSSCSGYRKDMCLCTGGGRKVCANRDELKCTYLQGNTEYQDFAANQRSAGGPFWHSSDFNLY